MIDMSKWTSLKDAPLPRNGRWVVMAHIEDGSVILAHVDVVVPELDVWYIFTEIDPDKFGYTHWKYLNEELDL